MNPTDQRQHLVPQSYLERFHDDAGGFEMIDRDNYSRVFPSNARHALAERGFYAIDTDDGPDNSVEEMFAQHVEKPAKTALDRLIHQDRPIIAPGIRGPIAQFVAFQKVRGARSRYTLVEHMKATAERMMELTTPAMMVKTLREMGEEISLEEAADTLDSSHDGSMRLEIRRASSLHMGAALKSALGIAEMLDQRSWQLLEFSSDVLATCDEPVLLIGDDWRHPGDAGGLAGAREVVMPLDPRRALVMIRSDIPADQGRRPAGPEQAKVINTHVAFHAHKFIIRRTGTNPLDGIKVPKRAHPIIQVGDFIAMAADASESARDRLAARLAASVHRKRRRRNNPAR